MKIAVVAEQETAQTKKLLESINQQEATGFFQSVAEFGIFIKKNRSFLNSFPENGELNTVFFQLPSKFMAFLEPLLLELSERSIFLPAEPGSYFLLSNEPYLFHVLNRKGVQIPKTIVFADPVPVKATALQFPVFLTAYRGIEKIEGVTCKNHSTLQTVLKSLPIPLDCVMIQERPNGNRISSIVIGEQVFSAEFAFNAKKREHQKKGRFIKLGAQETENIIRASRAIGLEIAQVESVQNQITSVSPLLELEKMEQNTGQDLYKAIARFLIERGE